MVLRRSALLTAAFAAVALTLPALASATDYCFGSVPGCSGAIYDDGELAKKLTDAESNGTPDRFFLADDEYVNGPFSHQSSERVEIIGAGADRATLQSDAPGSVLMLGGNPDSAVRGVTIKAVGSATVGLRLTGTSAQGVSVDATTVPTLLAGVIASDGAVFDNGSVDIGAAWMLPDVLVLDNSATVTDSRLVAPKGYGVLSTLSDATVRRSTLDAKFGASASAGHLTVSDTLIDLRGKGSNATGPAIGVGVGPDGSATTATADLDRLTIVGSTPDTVETRGVAAGANGATNSATVHLRDSVISGAGVPLSRQGINGATVNITTDRSLYPQPVFPISGGPGTLLEEHRLSGSPGFVNEAGGDFHLAAGSALVDAGTPSALPAETADRDGNQRPSDGDGDGTAISDIGAFELQGTAGHTGGTAGVGTGAGGTSAPAGAPPVLSHLRVPRTRITLGARLPRLLAASTTRRAGTIGFVLSKGAKVRLRFTKLGKGGRARTIKTRLRVTARQGANRLHFAGRLNRKVRLTAGVYRLTAIAIDTSGARSQPVSTRFTAIQRPRH
jgi:hypothetical protein